MDLYEQKYKNALDRARIGLHDCNLLNCDDMTRRAAITTIYHLFPELTEDEDERIRKGIIRNLQYLMDRSEGFVKEDLAERIAWLEKQGEHPTDKVEPKFKVKDWVILNGTIAQILDKQKYGFVGLDINGKDFFCNYGHTDSMRLWTIADAKDGDVLAYVTDEEDLWIMIYRSLYEPYEGHVHYHALLVNDNFSDKGTCCICIDNLKPATKEQRDLLIEKMEQAGYEWNAEKKELKKIEGKKLDADKVIEWLHYHIQVDEPKIEYNEDGQPLAESFLAHAKARCIDADEVVKQFKKDFGL